MLGRRTGARPRLLRRADCGGEESAATATVSATARKPSDAQGEPSDTSGERSDSSVNPSDAQGEPSDKSGERSDSSVNPSDAQGEPSDTSGERFDSSVNPSDAQGEPSARWREASRAGREACGAVRSFEPERRADNLLRRKLALHVAPMAEPLRLAYRWLSPPALPAAPLRPMCAARWT